jgi:acyl carrier protein phosphodiesterase
MNYLAHAYLSFGNEPILIGNMISDFVKGNKKFNYPENIQKGIALHRMIDTFTDTHVATKNAKEIFKSSAHSYAPVFVDVVYDHFLSVDETQFPLNKLEFFATETYGVLKKNTELLPEKFNNMLPYMINQNWLLNYRFDWGIENSFGSIFRRAKYLEKNNLVFQCFHDNYNELQACYKQFFPDVKDYAFNEYNLLVQE